MLVDQGWLEEGITLGQSAVSDETLVRRPIRQTGVFSWNFGVEAPGP